MKLHYEFTGETKLFSGIILKRIRATTDSKYAKKGELGGFIEAEINLSGDAWVYGNTRVYGNARVYGDAQVYGNAQVSGNARVSGNAQVYGNARVSGDARVYGNARVSGDAHTKSPLYIQWHKHSLTLCKKGHIQIGCYCKTFEDWKRDYKKVGKENGYTVTEIKQYGLFIDLFISIYGKKGI